jgi:hypothetical protein
MKESSNFIVQTSVSLDRSLRPMDLLPIFTKRFAEKTYQGQVCEKLCSHCGQYDSSLSECDAIVFINISKARVVSVFKIVYTETRG